jgi:hypothetical protein
MMLLALLLAVPPSLAGTWQSACYHDVGQTIGVIERFTFDGTRFSGENDTFEDVGCTKLQARASMSGTWSVQPGDGAIPLDLNVTAMAVTYHTQAVVVAQNAQATCGKTDWKVGERVDLTALCLKGSPTTVYTVYRAKDGKLVLGDVAGEAAKRPADVLPARTFERKP